MGSSEEAHALGKGDAALGGVCLYELPVVEGLL